jgi:hypothetical protein
MKLQRYNQFVKKLNEEREAPAEYGKYDSVDDFRKQMAMKEEETETVPMTDFDSDDTDVEVPSRSRMMPEDDSDMMDNDDMPEDDEDMMDFDDMTEDDEDMMNTDDMSDNDEGVTSEYDEYDESKLYDLAKMLGVEVVDNQVTFGDEVVNFYSETGNLHIGNKEFETAEEAAEFLKGGSPRMARDTNESRSYRFNRSRRAR